MKKRIRRWFTCRVLGHDWRVYSWGHQNRIEWDGRSWRCIICQESRRTNKIWDEPGIGALIRSIVLMSVVSLFSSCSDCHIDRGLCLSGHQAINHECAYSPAIHTNRCEDVARWYCDKWEKEPTESQGCHEFMNIPGIAEKQTP